MKGSRYEKYVGFKQNELKYKKEMAIDEVSGNQVEKLVERTPEEIDAYITQKELEFDGMLATWNRLGIKKCATQKVFDEKNFNKIYLKLVDNRLKELSNSNPDGNIENKMLKSIDDVDKKYNLGVALRYFNVDYTYHQNPSKIFKGLNRTDIEKMFYKRITTEKADELARERLQKSTTKTEGVALIQELQKTHQNRSIFFKLFHPFKNSAENRLISEMKNLVMQKFNMQRNELDAKLTRNIDKSKLGTAKLYKVDEFVDNYCKENSGKIYSQNQINIDRQNVEQRAEDDFIDSQRELSRLISEEEREPIVVEDALNMDNQEHSQEQIVEDPKIIRVPNNNNH